MRRALRGLQRSTCAISKSSAFSSSWLRRSIEDRSRRHNMTSYSYDLIVGLETHVQLLTETKLFCGCSTKFGASPNTQTCPVCTGMPGSLPVMNREAFRLSLKTAVAL